MKIVQTQFTQPSIRTFLDNQLSPCTRLAYELDLRQFFGHVSADSIEMVSTQAIVEYRNALRTRYSVSSVNRKVSTVRALYKYLHDIGSVPHNPAASVKLYPASDNATTEALSDVEVNAVLSSIAVDSDAGVMHHAALSILLYLGLRAAELRSLTLESLGKDRDVHTITIDGKGNRKRIIPLPAEVILSLDRYLRSYARASIREALFTATNRKDGKPLSHEALTKIVKKYSRLAGISKTISPHSLRATCVSNALENGASMVQVQYLAGWKSSAMIQRYDKRSSILKNSAAYAVNYNKE